MSDADIQRIIIAVAYKKAIDARRMRAVKDNCVLMFVAIYPSWDDDKRELWQIPEAGTLADRVLKLGWDGIWIIAWAWQAKTIYYLTGGNKRFTEECRQRLARESDISTSIALQQAPGNHDIDSVPDEDNHCATFARFAKRLFDDLDARPYA